jgi:26S proteasome non-ATPase regulatory subunit 9
VLLKNGNHLASMENLHAPTVPSGPTSAPSTNGTQINGLTFSQLQAKKDNIEAEIRALNSVLTSVGVLSHMCFCANCY